jgi:diacylglycerol kinase (ATP)
MEIAVLHNPTAGDKELPRPKLLSLLREAGYQPRYFSLKEKAWKKPRALRGVDFVVVAGGDGSVRQAVLNLFERGWPLAFLPLGTANNICASLGIAGTPRQVIASWARAERRRIDLGVARGPWGRALFVESAGVGLIGRVITVMDAIGEATRHRVERREDRLHRDFSVVLALAHELKPVKLNVAVDGARAGSDEYLLFEIMNISRAGPGLELAPGADPADGQLEIVSATAAERAKLILALANALGGGRTGACARRKTRTIVIQFATGEFRLDDRVVWRRPNRRKRGTGKRVKVEISVQPSAVEVLLPRH